LFFLGGGLPLAGGSGQIASFAPLCSLHTLTNTNLEIDQLIQTVNFIDDKNHGNIVVGAEVDCYPFAVFSVLIPGHEK
jgi:hypothetical protein